MKTFNFPYHRVGDAYPQSSTPVQYGGGYEFASKPRGPDQIVFKLNFAAMWYFEGPPGFVDATREPERNMAALQAFYEEHRLYEKFIYPHARRGNVVVRFKKPLEIPEGVIGGNGMLPSFTIELTLQP